MDIQILLAQVEATDAFGELAPPMQIAILLGALSFATAALVSLTAFTRIIIVLSFVRRALSTTEIPPNQVMLGLSFFLTLFVMAPTLEAINTRGVQPYLAAQQQSEGTAPEFGVTELVTVSTEEIRRFMTVHTRGNDLQLFVDLANLPETTVVDETPLKVLIPAFIISELKTAFQIGFMLFLPFLVIDLVVASVLMSLGMMMLSPTIISLPFKLLLFVLVDGWALLMGSLAMSFG